MSERESHEHGRIARAERGAVGGKPSGVSRVSGGRRLPLAPEHGPGITVHQDRPLPLPESARSVSPTWLLCGASRFEDRRCSGDGPEGVRIGVRFGVSVWTTANRSSIVTLEQLWSGVIGQPLSSFTRCTHEEYRCSVWVYPPSPWCLPPHAGPGCLNRSEQAPCRGIVADVVLRPPGHFSGLWGPSRPIPWCGPDHHC